MKNLVFHERSKHIDIKLHFIRDVIAQGYIKVLKINTELNSADAMIKVLPTKKFNYCFDSVGCKTSDIM